MRETFGSGMCKDDNYIIKSSPWHESDLTLFYKMDGTKEDISLVEAKDIQDLMVIAGAYKSRSESFAAGRKGPIPTGWTEMWANKKKQIYIWNPTHNISYYEEDAPRPSLNPELDK